MYQETLSLPKTARFAVKGLLLALASLGVMSSQAADVKLYGRVDTGFLFQNLKGQSSKYELRSGGRSTPRVGLTIVEKMTNGLEAKVYLENGFKMDTGEFGTSGTLFDRRSILALKGAWGELGAGRAGTVQSTMAPYSMGSIKWDPYGTSYGFSSVGSTFANTGRTDNGLFYHSPTMNGFKVGVSYSLGDKGDDQVEWHQKAHTFASALSYSQKDLWVGLTYAHIEPKEEGAKSLPHSDLVQFGGWWRFMPEWRVFFGTGYQHQFASAAKMTRKVTLGGVSRSDTFTGTSYLLGADWVRMPHKVMVGVQHFRGEADNQSIDLKRTVASVAYEYYLRKNVILYSALNRSKVSGDTTSADNKLDGTQLFCGLNINW